jgi:hypothetical protein
VFRRVGRPFVTKCVEVKVDPVHFIRFCFRGGCYVCESRGSSVGMALGYGLDDRGYGVEFPAGAGNFSLHRVQNGFGAHPVSYPMGTRGSFLLGKAAGA